VTVRWRTGSASLLAAVIALAACGQATPSFPAPDQDYSHVGLSDAEASTLLSLEQVSDYPLYTMHLYAEYNYREFKGPEATSSEPAWACTLFAALADPEARLFARNLDWRYSPTLVLFTDPADGYAAVTFVDIEYLGFTGELAKDLDSKPIEELSVLLDAHHIPFDGMNEAGLAIAMAAVPPGQVPTDPEKDNIGSLGIIRAMLDQAGSVGEAIELFDNYNIDFEGGPPLHYLMADARGDSALVEHYEGEIHVVRTDTAWHAATNFLESSVESTDGQCWRHDIAATQLEQNSGALDSPGAFALLEDVSQPDTQYSVVYNTNTGEVRVAMARTYDRVFDFQLDMLEQ